jgi:hypothetical protein
MRCAPAPRGRGGPSAHKKREGGRRRWASCAGRELAGAPAEARKKKAAAMAFTWVDGASGRCGGVKRLGKARGARRSDYLKIKCWLC